MTKEQLRVKYKLKRGAITPAAKEKLEDLILIRFQSLLTDIPDVIMTYAACEKQHEYDPGLAERFSAFRNPAAVFAFPVTGPGHSMQAFIVNDETAFAPNAYGIDEPVNGIPLDHTEIDMVFVPLLAFDEKGFRVGYGKGYYDRFLLTCRKDVCKIGFSFFEAEEQITDADAFDIALDICITPYKTYTFIH